MIELLNTYFVPVYASNEDHRGDGPAPADERAECRRIYLEALNAKLSAGTVHVYVTNPDGHTIDSQHVSTACKVEELTAMLERTVQRLKTAPGNPLTTPESRSNPPSVEPGSVVLHLTARNLVRENGELAPVRAVLGTCKSCNWGSYAVENWLVLNADDCSKLLPVGDVAAGESWVIDRAVAAKFLTYFYPSTENNDVSKNRIDRQTLKATVLSRTGGVTRARLDGTLMMQHSFYHKDDGNFVDATFVGVLDFEPATKKVRSLQIATTSAVYGINKTNFGVVLRSESFPP